MRVTALAGGIGAGKFLRGLARVVDPRRLTVVVNTGDDIRLHGLHVSPDLDSVVYWVAGCMDRDRGWGRRDETFRTNEELRRLDTEGAWFNLGDLDLAVHLLRTGMLDRGSTLSEATTAITDRFGLEARVLPMSDDPVETRIAVVHEGEELDLHFQEYWVRRRATDEVKAVRFAGVDDARPAPGVLEAVGEADAVLLCPSNPVVSLGPILAVPGVRPAVAARRSRVVGVSPIVGGVPLAGMADKLMPAAGVEVTAAGAAEFVRDLLGAWVIDERDAALASRIEAMGVRVGVTDSVMTDDAKALDLARTALGLLG